VSGTAAPVPPVVRAAEVGELAGLRLGVLGWRTPVVERDGLEGALHLAVVEHGSVVGCCSVVPGTYKGVPATHLYAVAVSPDHQRCGVGSLLVAEAVLRARGCGHSLVWCRARGSALGFWRRQGATTHGPWFHEPLNGQLERVMVVPVPSQRSGKRPEHSAQ